ncbi:xanthine dehydrogenase family protein molybdopterin-binding subunit [Halovulum dunhuangense]|uniref:Xanthine dehydrogenase family protein molybdopterin-binding subunit n=1 Tax=Halovulum dunhuangense TaxID=1505036 RepID=A0A849L278_9RHOB|nr:xanthine dehydrogenase family protein molybdopterin-binding subunit [Halovulum dunhuangense]NNU80327.1 xanthine dehydrogenase family protein molybdopterin-binding subunit [Halovulum dunhuangense]
MGYDTTRRGFLASATATAAALVVGFTPRGTLAATGEGNLTPFVKITPDGRMIAILKHFEMGQGTTTGLTALIAEELNADLDLVEFEFAPSDNSRYANTLMGAQGTGGSTAIANSYLQYRKAGAAAREMLVAAAATEWGVDAATLTLENGVISGGGNSAPIADFVAAAAGLAVPEEPALKDPADFRVIGQAGLKRRDTGGKIDGSALFGMDIQLPGQIVAAVLRPPRLGARLDSFDAAAAAQVPGFIDAKARPEGAGVIVYARNTWAAFQARDAIAANWDFSAAESRSSAQIREELLARVNAAPDYNATPGSDAAAVAEAIAGAAQVVEAEFYFPNLAHAPMEPLNCTIEPVEGGVVVHDGCQFPAIAHPTIAAILQLDPAQVQINTIYAGGSFGRRANPAADYHVEAAQAFALSDRSAPVKLVWSREDDIRGGYYRPAFAHKVRVGLDAAGAIVGWEHRIAGQSIFKGTAFEAFVVKDGVDHSSVEGVADTPYAIPGMHVGLSDAAPSVTVLWWRSVGHTHTAYVMESMMDMAARAAGRDPVEFRLAHLSGDSADHARMAGVLRLAAERAGWDQPAPEGRSRGVAVHKSFGSYVAEVVEISGDAESGVRVEKVTCAVDCGLAITPDVVRAQVEGGVGYGMGAVMRNQITLESGEVVQTNFWDYEPLRIQDIGAIEVHIVPSAEAPSGIGEPGTPPAGPALANAIAARGPRVTMLPMSENGVSFA